MERPCGGLTGSGVPTPCEQDLPGQAACSQRPRPRQQQRQSPAQGGGQQAPKEEHPICRHPPSSRAGPVQCPSLQGSGCHTSRVSWEPLRGGHTPAACGLGRLARVGEAQRSFQGVEGCGCRALGQRQAEQRIPLGGWGVRLSAELGQGHPCQAALWRGPSGGLHQGPSPTQRRGRAQRILKNSYLLLKCIHTALPRGH